MYFIVYETTNIKNGKKYRGCHVTEDLDDGYLGSGTHLKRAVKKYGTEAFTRKILSFCDDIEHMIAEEAKCVDEEWVKRSDTYNLQTGGLGYGILSEESKKKISNTIKQKHIDGCYRASSASRRGAPTWNKGKTGIYSEKTLQSWSEKRKGVPSWNKDKKLHYPVWNKGMTKEDDARLEWSEEAKEKVSKTMKKKYAENGHHLKGRKPWNAGKKGVQESWNKGLILKKSIICPHCGAKGANVGNMKRWHFDNCKVAHG